jgi:glycosyltransferase involved in cell wall biosynthesis
MPAEIVKPTPNFSVIIPVHNDWGPLDGCLESLKRQSGNPEFEVIVVDDGSRGQAPDSIRQYGDIFPLRIIQQPHAGVAAARNRGIQSSKGAVLVFTDADCRLDPACLAALEETIFSAPEHHYFQLHLTGYPSNLLGRAEELRLLAIQTQLLQPDGRIRYLNTSGFAVRRSAINPDTDLFDPSALRSEDTLLLTNLIQKGALPLLVGDAVVRHSIEMSFGECIRKDVRVARLETRTFERIAAKGVQVRMNNLERFTMLRSTWKASAQPSIGRTAWLVLTARQATQRLISLLCRCLPSD